MTEQDLKLAEIIKTALHRSKKPGAELFEIVEQAVKEVKQVVFSKDK